MKSKIIAIFSLIIAVTFGALLPKIVLIYQDNKIQKSTEKYSVEQKKFKTENRIINTLDYYSKGLMYEVKDSVTDVNLSEKQIKRNIKEFLKILNKHSLYQIEYSDKIAFKYEAALYVSDYNISISDVNAVNEKNANNNLNSDSKYILFHCTLENKDGIGIDLQMDDETGKVIAFNIYNKKTEFKLFKSVEMAKNFITEYYEINADFDKSTSVDEQWFFVLYDEEISMKTTLEIYMSYDNGIHFNQ